MRDDDVVETAKFFGLSLAWVSMLGIMVICVVAVFVIVEPALVSKQTQTTRQSNAYITSKQTALRTWQMSWNDLETQRIGLRDPNLRAGVETQQQGIVRQMRQDADTIPEHVPPDIKQFLATH